ncbi:ADP-ribosylglycohydrolase family protein, partial [Rhodopirellula bahusiensis]
MSTNAMTCDAIVGCLFGTAVGDALGLPYEGVSPQRAERLLGPAD